MSEIKERKEITAEELKALLGKQKTFSDLLIIGSLEGVDASAATFSNCVFMDCRLTACSFKKAVFINCSFYGCDIKLADFTRVNFVACTFTSRFVMCDFSYANFSNSAFRRGYIANSKIDLTAFFKVVFDGIWAKHLIILGQAFFEDVSYTMGGATHEEAETQKELFFKAFEK